MKTNKISHYIAIDLGTNITRVFIKKHGIIFNEASIIAFDTKSDNKIISIGNNAKTLLGKTAEGIVLKRPIENGAISDPVLIVQFINAIFEHSGYKNYLKSSYMTISSPTNINKTEKDGLTALCKKLGAKYCEVQEDLLLAVFGLGLNTFDSNARLIIDLGAGKTSVGIITTNRILESDTLKIGGNTINNEIIKFVKAFYDLNIGYVTAENIKRNLTSLKPKSEFKDITILGSDVTSQLPKQIYINGEKITKILIHTYNKICELTAQILGSVKSDVITNIIDSGIYIIGGGAKTHGIKEYFHKFLNIKVNLDKDCENTIINGAIKYENVLLNNYNGIYNELELDEKDTK